MPTLLLYLLQASTALVLFFLGYCLVFRRLTFYALNRLFLLVGIIFSIVYPLIDLAELSKGSALLTNPIHLAIDWHVVESIQSQAHFRGGWPLVLFVFWSGVGLMTLRLLVQLMSFVHIHRKTSWALHNGIRFRQIDDDFNPFSFWQTIYLNPAKHSPEELEPILQHEQIHVSEWHTLDILLAELCLVFFWFNPVSWFIKKAMKENLEFRVDQQLLKGGFDAKNYQYMLVRIGGLRVTLATNFTELTLKKRIGMMNRKPSPRKLMTSYILLLVIVGILILSKMPGASVNRTREMASMASDFSMNPETAFAVIDTPNGTLNLIKQIQLKSRKAGKEPPNELILFSKNSAGRGMDVYVKLKDDQIEQLKILALAPPHFSERNFSTKPLGKLK